MAPIINNNTSTSFPVMSLNGVDFDLHFLSPSSRVDTRLENSEGGVKLPQRTVSSFGLKCIESVVRAIPVGTQSTHSVFVRRRWVGE